MLGWSKSIAAKKAKIGEATVQRIRMSQKVTESNRDRLIEAVEAGGIEFLPDGGVRLRKITHKKEDVK